MAGDSRGGLGLRDRAHGRPRRHPPGGPAALQRPGQRRERDRGHACRVAARRLRHRRGLDQLEPGRALLLQGSGNRDALHPAGSGRSPRHGGRQLRRLWRVQRPLVGHAGQGGEPPGRRPARAGRRRHQAHREQLDRRLHRRDHHGSGPSRRTGRIGWRLQPPIFPSRLSRWRSRDRKDQGRARRGRCWQREPHPDGLRRRRQDIHHAARRYQRLRAAVGRAHRAGRPVRPSRPRLRQPRYLPHRRQLQLPQGISRCHDR